MDLIISTQKMFSVNCTAVILVASQLHDFFFFFWYFFVYIWQFVTLTLLKVEQKRETK